MTQFVLANNVSTQLAAALTSSATTLTLASSTNLPALGAGQVMPLTLNDAATRSYFEVLYVTAISGTTLTITRGNEGTSALNWSLGDYAYCAPTLGTLATLYGNPNVAFMVGAPTATGHAAQFGQIAPIYSIASVPATQAAANGASAITVLESGEIWPWVSTAYYTGYRSVNIGSPIASAYVTPRAHEIDAVGGTLSKTTYARLWAYAQENGLVVASGSWVAGSLNFIDLGSGNFQAPDLRNMFIRLAAGATDPDTANARALGSYKADTYRSHSHPIPASPVAAGGGEDIAVLGTTGSGANTSANGTAETAPKHVALYPRIVI